VACGKPFTRVTSKQRDCSHCIQTNKRVEELETECERLRASVVGVCVWQYKDDNCFYSYWETACEQAFVILEGSPEENNYRHCPYCGKVLVEEKSA
jgi:DNA-directed RNA polymerase subunit RPC12/RpoP